MEWKGLLFGFPDLPEERKKQERKSGKNKHKGRKGKKTNLGNKGCDLGQDMWNRKIRVAIWANIRWLPGRMEKITMIQGKEKKGIFG